MAQEVVDVGCVVPDAQLELAETRTAGVGHVAGTVGDACLGQLASLAQAVRPGDLAHGAGLAALGGPGQRCTERHGLVDEPAIGETQA